MPHNVISSERPMFGSPMISGEALQHGMREVSQVCYRRCTILRVNPEKGKCDIYGEGCYYSDVALPGLTTSSEGAASTIEVPKRGTPVLARVVRGIAAISQYLPVPTDTEAESKPRFSVAETQESANFYSTNDGPTYGRLPRGLLPGDWCKMGEEGQCFALLEGGVAKMRGSPLAQVEAIHDGDTLKLTGRNMQLLSGFGRVVFSDDGGKSAFLFEGGTDQITQVGGGEEKWQVRARVGGEAQGIADFQLLNLRGERLFSVSLSNDGSINGQRSGNTSISYGGTKTDDIKRGYSRITRTGNDSLRVADGNRIEWVGGNHQSEIFGTRDILISGSRHDNIRNTWGISVGRTMSFNISGAPIPVPIISKALSYEVTNGDVVFKIGDPLAGDLQSALSSFRVNVKSQGGQIDLQTGPTGLIWIDSGLPVGSIMIGGSMTSPAIEPAVLGIQLIKLLTQLATYYDTHQHIPPPPLSMFGPVMTPIPPMYGATVASAAPTLVSKKVLIGR